MLTPSAPFSQSSTESWQSYFLNSTRVHPPLHFPHQHHLSLDHSTRLLPGLPSPFSVCSSSFSTWQPDQIFHLHLWFKWLSITLRKMPQTLLARPSRPHMVWSHELPCVHAASSCHLSYHTHSALAAPVKPVSCQVLAQGRCSGNALLSE